MTYKILIVDDETNIRMTLRQCFSGDEYQIDTAVNGEEALAKVGSNNYDLMLLDIKMPGLNGMQVLQKLRQQGHKVNVIMMTAYGTVERAVEAMKLGAIDFVSKPFTPSQIRDIVSEVLSRKKLEEGQLEGFSEILQFAKKCIVDQNYNKAEEYLKRAIGTEVDAAEPHNLLGVIAEYRGDLPKAQMHYRAAIALDPTYSPARANLERTAQFNYTKDNIKLGDEDVDQK